MENLINLDNRDGIPLARSSEVAKNFNIRPSNANRVIERLISENSKLSSQKYFSETTYKTAGNNKSYKEYWLTKDAFLLFVMSIQGKKALEWKLRYIEAFNKMEEALKENYQNLSKELRAIFVLDKKTNEIENRITEVEETAYVLPFQKKALINARTKKVLSICGGKNSLAYKDRSLRSRIYADLSRNVKEIFSINEYDAIPRKKFYEAMSIIENYALPIHLEYAKEKVTSLG
ncbi:phage regulatory protein [Clostridium sediminicola]|uniref:ORF6C domain-containing protein n=1 Tax=Clostridium sediminicola TaxID=3114879 RepID=UPI0031F1ED40